MALSNSNQPPSAPLPRPPKTMSSNLMTMKFMQRAAAAQSQHAPPAPATPPGSSERPSKRQKTDTRTPDYGAAADAVSGSPATTTPQLSDLQRMEMATAAEEAKRERAIERLATEAGETKWVLDATAITAAGEKHDEEVRGGAMRIARAGYGDIDKVEGGSLVSSGGRRSYGRFNKEIEKWQSDIVDYSSQVSPCSESHSSSSSSHGVDGEEGEVEDAENDHERDPSGVRELIQAGKAEASQRTKAARKTKRKSRKREIARLAKDGKPKDVRLNKLSSISKGGAGGGLNGRRDMSQVECFQCGKKGHEKKDCPNKTGSRNRDAGMRVNNKSEGSLDY